MMRSLMLSAVSGIALVSSAFAADIYPGVSYKETPALLPVSTWAGFYVGVNGGYGGNNSLNSRADVFFPNFATTPPAAVFTSPIYSRLNDKTIIDGGFGGGQLGYNFQWGSWVLGFETDIQGSGIRGSGAQAIFNSNIGITPPTSAGFCAQGLGGVAAVATTACAERNSVDVDFFGTVRGRVGFAWGDTLIYGTGGFAYGGVKESFSYTDNNTINGVGPQVGRVSNSKTATGWTAGAGIEVKLAPNWSLKGEYQFIDLGSISAGPGEIFNVAGATPCPSGAGCLNLRGKDDISFNTVRVGVNYYFNTPYVPLK